MRRACGFFSSLILLALLAVALLTMYLSLYQAPRQARNAFGPPTARLSLRQRATISYHLIINEYALKHPLHPGGQPQTITVQPGDTPAQAAQALQQAGLIDDPQAFIEYMIYTGIDTRLKPGNYTFGSELSPVEIANRMQDVSNTHVAFHVLPGWRLEEVAQALPTSGLGIDPAAFLESARNPEPALRQTLGLPDGASLEGYLFPDAYQLARNLALDDFLQTLAANFQLQANAELRQAFQDQGLSVQQAVTLASLVQREAMRADEMPTIASVFSNRLQGGMRLDSDPTVQYALGSQGGPWWKSPLALADLQIVSPYNTYQIAALPPGPICSPGRDALQAVAHPAQTPYFFFRAACDASGRHNFARTFEEHKANACP